jgi:hypothetical protein
MSTNVEPFNIFDYGSDIFTYFFDEDGRVGRHVLSLEVW